jgi:hypothetical protein
LRKKDFSLFSLAKERKFKERSYKWLFESISLACVEGKGLVTWKGVLVKKRCWIEEERMLHIEQVFFSLDVVFRYFVLNSRTLDCSNGFA